MSTITTQSTLATQPTGASRPMSAEEFAAWVERPENVDRHFELRKGKVIEMPPPRRKHGYVCANTAWLLTNYSRSRGIGIVCTNNAGVIIERSPDTVRGPDVAYFDDVTNPVEITPEYATVPPVVAVEVLSPDDRVNHVAAKVDDYLAFGVKQVWVVDPETKDVAVHRRGPTVRLLIGDDEVSGGQELPGFSCRVSDFFQMPGLKAT